ncbi:MAG: RsmE family RNA methyltransferase [Planctomycetota bacterium]|nr:RsmE family RNA methyltransferase [Planctomycetota bacterium]
MPHHRAFCESLLTDDVVIDETEAHHLMHVLRLRPGDQLLLFDGCGMEADAVIQRTSRREVYCSITSRRKTPTYDRTRLTVIAAPPKAERLKWMVEKLTEIGVESLILLQTERSVVTPGETRIEKLRSTVVGACKQCHRNDLMDLAPLRTLVSVLDDVTADRLSGRLWIAHPMPMVATPNPNASPSAMKSMQSQLLLIGPEGGFTEAEYRAASDAGADTISWPDSILRVETAAIVFASQLMSRRVEFAI